MSRIATKIDFEEGGMYDEYHRFPFFEWRVDALKELFPPSNQKIAIWGCGWGYLVDEAVKVGFNVYGFDASEYAIDKGRSLLPHISDRLFIRDALSVSDVNSTTTENQKFALAITEDMLPCMNDDEVDLAISLLRKISELPLVHILTPSNAGGSGHDSSMNWKPDSEWSDILQPDRVLNQHGELV